MESNSRAISVPKIVVGGLLIMSQLIRQPGFGFWAAGANENSPLAAASSEVLGYDLFAVLMYALGVFLIWKGIPRKKLPS
jgi:hypothetical protein